MSYLKPIPVIFKIYKNQALISLYPVDLKVLFEILFVILTSLHLSESFNSIFHVRGMYG